MILNHINLPVADVGATRDFFAEYFGMKAVFELPKNTLAMMRDEGAMVLILSHFDKDKAAEVDYHKDFHVGFIVETAEEVDASHARFVAGGLAPEAPRRMAGRYGFYFKAPGGFEVEVAKLEGGPRPASRPGPDPAAADEPMPAR